ncbi:EAL domain-containing protein [Brevibacillus sp. GCM10020057]|uniref:EAL domain-containing protein n=1 Tax=Brevibacillus sp. GCM10020057 TaxID=3317327 RepID=UPI003633A0B5
MSKEKELEGIKQAERLLEQLIQETHSKHGFLLIKNQDSPDAPASLFGLTLCEEDKRRCESFLHEKWNSQSPIMLDITADGPLRPFYQMGSRYGVMIPLHDEQDSILGIAFLCRDVAYSRDVVAQVRLNDAAATSVAGESLNVRQKRYEQSAKALFKHNPDVIWWMDHSGTILSVNSRVGDVFGFQKNEFENLPFDRFIAEKDAEKALRYFLSAKKGSPQNFEATFIHKEGRDVELNLTLVPITVEYKIAGVYGIAKDITDRKRYEEALKESNELITNLLESITDGFIAVDSDFRVTYCNKEAELLLEKKREHILGQVLWEASPGIFGTASCGKLHKAMDEHVTVKYEQNDSPAEKWFWIHAYPAKNGISVFFQDITRRKKAEQQIVYLTYYDTLTGLPNQRYFADRLNLIVTRGDQEHEDTLTVMVIGLNRFQEIIDFIGREKGDRLLIAVSRCLSFNLHEDDTICRYEGDKFAVLLRNVNRVKAERIAERILEAFTNPIILDQQEIVITPSIGIAFYPTDGRDGENLLANADTAMREAKAIICPYLFYHECMNTNSIVPMEWELRKAFERNELMVYYQPQVDIRSGRISGIESLIRWKHPEWGFVLPELFIPLAEETGLIVPIGEWVLKTACAQNKAWQDAGFDPVVMSVNLSQRQITHGNLVETVKRALEETGLSPQYLCLEITESMTKDVNRTLETLGELKELGVKISMDDFGKGYSSLFYLKQLPIDTLKIDKSFIRYCTTDESDAMIVKMIISMAHQLNLSVIAEGVTSRNQLVFLQQHLCNEAQGFIFSKPLPADELERKFAEIQCVVKQYGINTEITERLWMEEHQRAARQEFEDTVRKQQGMMFKFKKVNGRFVYTLCDGTLLYKLGFVPEQVVGKDVCNVLPEGLAAKTNQLFSRAWEGEVDVSFEGRFDNIYYFTSLRPIVRGGKVVEVIGSSVDITARKQVEEELRKSAALAAIGELAAGIAHEIRNPLTSIKGFFQLMKSGQFKQEYSDIILSEFKNIETKLDELLLLAKPQAAKSEPTDLRALLQEVLIHLEREATLSNIEIKCEPSHESLMISGVRHQLKQLFVNLFHNAMEAMPGGGEILVRLERVDPDWVKVTIIDHGCGISKERLKRIGEPFFSTKEKGAGIGLTISHKIVKEHRGTIVFQSELNKGTTVEVSFPILEH